MDGVRAEQAPSAVVVSLGDLMRASGAGNLLATGTYGTKGHLDRENGLGWRPQRSSRRRARPRSRSTSRRAPSTWCATHAGVYAGRIVNPTFAELQTEGNVAFGVGQALFEEMVVADGQVANANLADYMIASFEDMPKRLERARLLEAGTATAEIHGLGESALPPVAPAIGNAVFDACGVRISELPVTPERVLRALRGLSEEQG